MLDAFKTCGSSPPKNYTIRTVSFRLVRGELKVGR
jgi:hypothetical protein